MLSDQEIKAYPSADRVIYGVAGAMLKLLFPGEIYYIDHKMASHRKARLLSGLETLNDLDAGEALGNKVAQQFVQRAKTDRAGAAIGTLNGVSLWTEFETRVTQMSEIKWISQETPKRPPMPSYFGRVKAFLFDSATLVNSVRHSAPPSTNLPEFKKELEEVKYYRNNHTREKIRIVHCWGDGVGTTLGHWNAIAAEEFVKMNSSEVRWARAYALLNMSLMVAAISCWDAKYTYYNPRQCQADPTIKTLTGVAFFHLIFQDIVHSVVLLQKYLDTWCPLPKLNLMPWQMKHPYQDYMAPSIIVVIVKWAYNLEGRWVHSQRIKLHQMAQVIDDQTLDKCKKYLFQGLSQDLLKELCLIVNYILLDLKTYTQQMMLLFCP